MLTLNGAISLGWQQSMGSIEVNKLANFIVLDRNLFEVAPSEIGATKVNLTVFEGEVVHEVKTR
jgi:predicted amidohydrolase YtcJ